jgi:chromosome segregation ATPase
VASDNKKNKKLVAEQDDDPTAELEALADPTVLGNEGVQPVAAESDANTFDFDKLNSEVGDDDETIASLKSALKSRTETIAKLQFDIEQLRSKRSSLEKEIEVREEVTGNLTRDLKTAHKKQARTEKLVDKRDREVKSLRSRIAARDKSLQESARLVEQSKKREGKTESRAVEIQAQLDDAKEKLSNLEARSQTEKSEQKDLQEQIRSLTDELAESRSSVAELQQSVDSQKTDWDRQESKLRQSEKRIERFQAELRRLRTGTENGGSVQDDLEVRLASLESERDELLTELRGDSQSKDKAAANEKLVAEQADLLTARNFEVKKLRNRISRSEAYADGLRSQLQDQLLLTGELQSRQQHLETSLETANLRIRELSDGIEDLRSVNQDLIENENRLKKEFEEEVRQIRFEIGEAQDTIEERDILTQQLASDLIDTRATNMNLEGRLDESEEEARITIAELKRKLLQLETMNEEMNEKLGAKDTAIAALVGELTKRSVTTESIDETGDVILELDDRISEQIDERESDERGRITRLLVGKIEGQKLRFPLFKNRLTIGRTGHNDIQLKAPFIGRRHAVIMTDDGVTRIVDWGSKNGVYVNTSRVKDQVLRNGDVVTIGTADFKFEERPKR